MINKTLLLISLLLLSGCKTDNNEKLVNGFDTNMKLIGEHIGPLNFFLQPMKIGFNDSLIFIIDYKKENLLHFFEKKNLNYISSKLPIGRGPGEYAYIDFFNQIDTSAIWLYAPQSEKFILYNLKNLIYNKQPLPDFEYDIPKKDLRICQQIFYISDTVITGLSTNGKGRIFFWNPVLNNIRHIKIFPKLLKMDPDLPLNYVGRLYYGFTGVKPDKTKIAVAMDKFKRIDVFNIDGKTVLSIVFPDFKEPKYCDPRDFENYDSGNSLQYICIYTSNNYIYALYFGKPPTDDNIYGKYIHVFDWKGNPVAQYELDIPIFSFVVDEVNKTIYGIRIFDERPIISYKY
jgi:hypothetical protein